MSVFDECLSIWKDGYNEKSILLAFRVSFPQDSVIYNIPVSVNLNTNMMSGVLKRMKSEKSFIEYGPFINSNKWKTIRKRMFKLRGKKCETCGSRSKIHVHHLTYERFGGDELDEDLLIVCSTCHEELHPSKPNSKNKRKRGPKNDLKKRIKATKRFLLFGGHGRSSNKCPTCKYVTDMPAFKKTYHGKMVPTDPDLTCGIVQGLRFQVHDNTYCKFHEPKSADVTFY